MVDFILLLFRRTPSSLDVPLPRGGRAASVPAPSSRGPGLGGDDIGMGRSGPRSYEPARAREVPPGNFYLSKVTRKYFLQKALLHVDKTWFKKRLHILVNYSAFQ